MKTRPYLVSLKLRSFLPWTCFNQSGVSLCRMYLKFSAHAYFRTRNSNLKSVSNKNKLEISRNNRIQFQFANQKRMPKLFYLLKDLFIALTEAACVLMNVAKSCYLKGYLLHYIRRTSTTHSKGKYIKLAITGYNHC